MSHGLSCDRCDETLLIDSSVRYELRIVVQAAYDPMEITSADLEGARPSDWEELLAELESLSEEEAQDQVYREFRLDLCPTCQREFLRDPLGNGRPLPPDAIVGPKPQEGEDPDGSPEPESTS
ncbi:MAG: hypothetical protein ACO4CW_01655 [Planctomycetota bacterium]|jgi:hypothetical protein